MKKTITVKGIGKVSVKPDYVVVAITLESKDREYERAMNIASEHIDNITETLCLVGFDKEDLKTTSFTVRTDYDDERDSNGNYKRIFAGYSVVHDLKISFDFDMEKLAKTLSAISKCISQPDLSISFTVKDPEAINEELLISATKNARKKAKILCKAANVKLGELKLIDYNWNHPDICSETKYAVDSGPMFLADSREIDIVPDDISTSDSATFVWEIK
ncbi:MAG: SIMPL domain-containing protein [Erysipelotrichaceae bacterium]|jgi:uncharacterized protein YggE